ncbi:MAG: DinB family protein [Deltaproteobacteria bacterium]|jgi:hypothetical protein|nr:DinB family protein [Deltaproteobacteria bacterium]
MMALAITDSLLKIVDDYFGVLDQFLKACPEDLWAETFANWPISQYFWHVLWINDRVLPGPNLVNPAGATDDAALFKNKLTAVSKAEVAKLWAAQKPQTVAFVNSLTEANQNQRNENIFQAIGVEWGNVYSVIKLHSHAFYHLGTFDAALRSRGLPGIY